MDKKEINNYMEKAKESLKKESFYGYLSNMSIAKYLARDNQGRVE